MMPKPGDRHQTMFGAVMDGWMVLAAEGLFPLVLIAGVFEIRRQ